MPFGQAGDALPLILGVGRTGVRIASRLAARAADDSSPGLRGQDERFDGEGSPGIPGDRAGRTFRFVALFPDAVPAGPTPVPAMAWPSSPAASARASADLGEIAGRTTSVVIVCNLAGPAVASVAPRIARAVRQGARTLSAVGIAPFGFEGPARAAAARAAAGVLAPVVDLLAVAEREPAWNILPETTTLDRAYAHVDEAAAAVVETLARVPMRGDDLVRLLDRPPRGCLAGAAEATGASACVDAVRAVIGRSLLVPELWAVSRAALAAFAVGRAPTMGELGKIVSSLRSALPAGTPLSLEAVVDETLGTRALAMVCLRHADADGALFPSEDPATLAIPAFLRRRGDGLMMLRRSA